MCLTDFIKIQNREMVESARISFKLFLPDDLGGKWFFFCNPGENVETLCKWVDDNNLNIDITWPYNRFEVEDNGEDDDGHPMYKYVFSFVD